MKVVIYDPFLSSNQDIEFDRVHSLEDLLPVCDYVTVHFPLTDETRYFISKNELAMMKPTSCIINAARGGIINEEDLFDALTNNVISFACLDVFVEEPINRNLPLLTLDNVILTPHSATHTEECLERMGLHAAQGIDEVLSGKSPTWPVNHI